MRMYFVLQTIRYGNSFVCVCLTPEPSTDVRNRPISEKYNSLKDYLDSTGEKISRSFSQSASETLSFRYFA